MSRPDSHPVTRDEDPRRSALALAGRSSTGASQLEWDLIDALIGVCQTLSAIAGASIADLEVDITPSQYRVLAVLATRGPQGTVDLAAALGVAPSTSSRVIDRLIRKQLVRRSQPHEDRRTIQVTLTEAGHGIVERVSAYRRRRIATILQGMPADERWVLTGALHRFADAADHGFEVDRALGCSL